MIRTAGVEPDIDVGTGHMILLDANRGGEEFFVIIAAVDAENIFGSVFHGSNISCSLVTLHSVVARLDGIDDIVLKADYLNVLLHIKIVTIDLAHPFADGIEAFKDEFQLNTIQFVQRPCHSLIIPRSFATLHQGDSEDSERVGPRIVLLGRDLAILTQEIREVVPGLTEGDFVSRGDVVLTKKFESF